MSLTIVSTCVPRDFLIKRPPLKRPKEWTKALSRELCSNCDNGKSTEKQR